MIKWFFRVEKSDFGFRAIFISLAIWYLGLIFIGAPISDSLNAETGIIGFILGNIFPIVIFPIVVAYVANKSLYKFRDIVDEQDKVKRQEYISSIDMPELALNFYEAVFQKYRYTNYEEKLSNFSDWIKFQSQNNRKRLDSHWNSELNQDLNRMRTHDIVQNWSNKFLEKYFSTNFYPVIVLFSEEQVDGTYHNNEVRLEIVNNTWVQSEIWFSLDKEENPTFQHFGVTPAYHKYSVGEDDNEDVVAEKIIKYMNKFIKKTRKLIR